MAKFKVGDKVRILDASKISDAILLGFETDGIYDVIGLDECERLFISSGKAGILLPEQGLQYIEKVKNNKRITALEKKIEEMIEEIDGNFFHDLERIEEIEWRLEHLEQAAKQYFVVPGEPSTVEDKPKTTSQEVNDFQKLFSVLEADYDLGVIELPSYVFDLPDSYKERVFKIYQILKDGSTPNMFAYAILDTVRAAFDLTER